MLPTIAPDELASWLGYRHGDAFKDAAAKLASDHGFPRKLPGRPLWSRVAVLQWIARTGGVEPGAAVAGAPALDPPDEDFAALSAELERQYARAG